MAPDSQPNIIRMIIIVLSALIAFMLTLQMTGNEWFADKVCWMTYGTGLTYTMLEQSRRKK